MKNLSVALAAHIATRDTTLATALRITQRIMRNGAAVDGDIFAYTTHDNDDVVEAVTYRAFPGLDITNIVIAADAAVGNLEMTVLHDGTDFTVQDILNGLWKNAEFLIFRYNYESISDGVDYLLAGTLGEPELKRNAAVIEMRDLRQYFQQAIGLQSSKNCRARLGDALCRVDLAGSPTVWTKNGTLTGVTSNQVFRDSSRTEAADFFAEGSIEFRSPSANAGITAKVKTYAADGTFTLATPLYGTVGVGDTYTAIAGCRKRRQEDCRDKFSNVLNFQGEPDRKGLNDLTAPAAANV